MALTVIIANRYECRENEIPASLYRVQYDESTSLTARGDPVFNTNAEFKTAVQDHLNWYNRQPTPFVSTFADYQHALNWANRLIGNGRARQVVILELDASKLGWLFSVSKLVKNGHITTHLPENMYQDEYLVLSSISSQSIIRKTVVSRRDLVESSSDEDEQASDSDDLVHIFDSLKFS
ncbi:hypothetical protein PI124_g17318 [Phytophthora idaei]|nr:hypothetical protein PI125_g17843 [Phytophthora idaei]KAG3139190.1 hypothetical protein PI126_g16564 [Phytophthora idaei]KAG3237710.1 hypothetical protein PI124_g17318 [Phytophthora idaei]